MTRAQKRAAKRIEKIKRLCAERLQAEETHSRDRIKEIDHDLQPLVCEQLRWERRQDRVHA